MVVLVRDDRGDPGDGHEEEDRSDLDHIPSDLAEGEPDFLVGDSGATGDGPLDGLLLPLQAPDEDGRHGQGQHHHDEQDVAQRDLPEERPFTPRAEHRSALSSPR
jgi:hypothetical protein